MFYIGRTVNLSATASRHRCDDIIPIYETTSVNNVQAVEEYLINYFYEHPKNDNDAAHSGGGVTEGYWNYVYVAIWR
jgi:hypothetical protein|tara:strand:- start:1206 stop:1436 length:231 start_codon:yes stop_codon:yes gene_type:complete